MTDNMEIRRKKFTHRKRVNNPNEMSVDTAFRNDWLNSSTVIGDEYFSVDI
jgi:hypothetical protein